MCRVSIHLDETNPLKPVAVLVVNGHECRMSTSDLTSMIADAMWAEHQMHKIRNGYYSGLADKYKEVQSAG